MNPEFQRNLWLEASPRRIVFTATVLALVLFAAGLLARNTEAGLNAALSITGMGIFWVCAFAWGGRAAGQAVLSEVSERTWEFQRLSALTPWSMTWGKLFGATAVASGAAVVGLVIHVVLAPAPGKIWTVIVCLGFALMIQALSLAAALVGVRKARAEGRPARTGGVLGGIVLAVLLLAGLARSSGFRGGQGLPDMAGLFGDGPVAWWSLNLPGPVFQAATVSAFAALSLVAAWRLMRLELQMRNSQAVWAGFLAFLAFWIAGFSSGQPGPNLIGATLAMGLTAYAAAFAEPADRVKLRGFAAQIGARRFEAAMAVAPATAAPLLFAVVLTLISPLAEGEDGLGVMVRTMALLAFIIRDLGVIALFRLGPRPQRGDIGALVALAVLYGVGNAIGVSLGGDQGPAIFSPVNGEAWVSIISGLAQAAIAWRIAIRRIRAPEVSLAAPPSGPASAPAS